MAKPRPSRSAPEPAALRGSLVRARAAGRRIPISGRWWRRSSARQSTLLIAPTGGGKTLSGFLPSLIDIHETRAEGIHTLYISPLKALTNDIERNLMRPIAEMGLAVTVESRTGDTPGGQARPPAPQPPNVFLTTPESLMLMLSASDAAPLFSGLRAVIVDEVHSFAASKRGDFTALALSRLSALAPQALRTGLSATVADPAALAAWLGPTGAPASVLQSGLRSKPDIRILVPEDASIPYGGFMARYAVPAIYEAIRNGRHLHRLREHARASRADAANAVGRERGQFAHRALSRLARPRTPAAHRGHDGGGENPQRGCHGRARAGHRLG